MSNSDIQQLQEYYQSRAPEYEAIYNFSEPARRVELDAIESLVRKTFKGESVLEIACGSGYWTELLSSVANEILAIDGSSAMLKIAQARAYTKQNVSFKEQDAYRLNDLPQKYDAALAGFWLSHVPKNLLNSFLSGLQVRLKSGAPVLLLDNNLVEGMGGALVKPNGNNTTSDTFKERKLADGTTYAIIKNYFNQDQLQKLLEPYAYEVDNTVKSAASSAVNITMGKWYWSALYLSK